MATVPFTLAHAAAGPPLWRLTGRRMVLSALVVGSMAPDFEYLVHLRTTRTIGHTLPGLILMCLPASLLVLALWHGVVKRPLATLAPDRSGHVVAAAHRAFPWLPVPRFVIISLSVLLGSWSHLAWDAFTHRNGLVVRHLDFLTLKVGVGHLHVYNLLQLASGLLGMALLVLWCRRWVTRASQRPVLAPAPAALPSRARWMALAVAAGAVAAGGLAGASRAVAAGGGPRLVVVQGVLGSMAAAALTAVALALVLEAALQRRRSEGL